MRQYPEGQTVHLECLFMQDGLAVDPENLHVVYELNDGDSVSVEPDQIVEGSWALDLLPPGPGILKYRWKGDGVATPDVKFRVIATELS